MLPLYARSMPITLLYDWMAFRLTYPGHQSITFVVHQATESCGSSSIALSYAFMASSLSPKLEASHRGSSPPGRRGRHKTACCWLFQSHREDHISSRQVQNTLDGIASRAGLQECKCQDKAEKNRYPIHPHMLRHSFVVWSLDSCVPVDDLQDQLVGHGAQRFG
jgi:hypothetical protein